MAKGTHKAPRKRGGGDGAGLSKFEMAGIGVGAVVAMVIVAAFVVKVAGKPGVSRGDGGGEAVAAADGAISARPAGGATSGDSASNAGAGNGASSPATPAANAPAAQNSPAAAPSPSPSQAGENEPTPTPTPAPTPEPAPTPTPAPTPAPLPEPPPIQPIEPASPARITPISHLKADSLFETGRPIELQIDFNWTRNEALRHTRAAFLAGTERQHREMHGRAMNEEITALAGEMFDEMFAALVTGRLLAQKMTDDFIAANDAENHRAHIEKAVAHLCEWATADEKFIRAELPRQLPNVLAKARSGR